MGLDRSVNHMPREEFTRAGIKVKKNQWASVAPHDHNNPLARWPQGDARVEIYTSSLLTTFPNRHQRRSKSQQKEFEGAMYRGEQRTELFLFTMGTPQSAP